MNLINKHQLQQDSKNYKVSPSETSWFRLEQKLELEKSQRKVNFYKYFSYAAIMVAILGVVSYFQSATEINNQDALTENIYQNQVTDLIDGGDAGIYDVSKLNELKLAYLKLGSKRAL